MTILRHVTGNLFDFTLANVIDANLDEVLDDLIDVSATETNLSELGRLHLSHIAISS